MTRRRLLNVGLWFLAIVIVIVNSGFAKPLWIDEYLHFAMGSLGTSEALQAIASSTGDGVNWGQTGAYLFVDHLAGSVFGANLWALRAPSIASGLVLLMSAVWFLRTRALPIVWQYLVVVALGGQWTLMFYVGEARPYLPMAASALAILAFYSTDIEERSNWTARALGFCGLVLGSLFHPYWLPIAAVLIAYVLWVQWRAGRVRSRAELVKYLSLPLLAVSVVLYLVLAALTWLRSPSSMTADPWEFVGGAQGWLRTIGTTHLDFMSPAPEHLSFLDQWMPAGIGFTRLLAVLLVLVITLASLLSRRSRDVLAEPVVLIWIGVLSTVAISGLSLINEYWIIQRQWLAGIALVPLAVVWALGRMWSSTRGRRSTPIRVLVGMVGLAILTQSALVTFESFSRISEHQAVMRDAAGLVSPSQEGEVSCRYLPDDPVRSANLNVICGGSVWREHGGYYGFADQ